LDIRCFCKQREKWRVISQKFQKKKFWPLMKWHCFYPSDLVNTKTTIPLRVGEEQWIYTLTLQVSVYIHHYSPPLRGIVVYYSPQMPLVGIMIICQDNKNSPNLINTHSEDNLDKKTSQGFCSFEP